MGSNIVLANFYRAKCPCRVVQYIVARWVVLGRHVSRTKLSLSRRNVAEKALLKRKRIVHFLFASVIRPIGSKITFYFVSKKRETDDGGKFPNRKGFSGLGTTSKQARHDSLTLQERLEGRCIALTIVYNLIQFFSKAIWGLFWVFSNNNSIRQQIDVKKI